MENIIMKYFKKLALCALILPVSAFSASAVLAETKKLDPGAESQSVQTTDYDSSKDKRDNATGTDRDTGMLNKPSDPNRNVSGMPNNASYLTATPNDAVHVENVIGSKLHIQSGNEEVGTINDLIIDESGQVVAVLVNVGGFLGMGQHPIAISWDSVERTLNEDRDAYLFSVNATEETLRSAPAYDKDTTGITLSSIN